MKKIEVKVGKPYPIYIEKGILQQAASYMQQIGHYKKIMIVCDDNVFPHYGDDIISLLQPVYEVHHIIVKHGEESKQMGVAMELYQALITHNFTRSDAIIALGGGVIGDLTGYVAATYLRGIALIQIPTSLLAQVDASVGGKVALNMPEAKNLIGTFYHPQLVLIDPSTLQTLPRRYFNDGMAEVIKYGCIKDASLFADLAKYESYEALYQDMEDIIERCVTIKRDIVELDPYDHGKRMLLNFGHTLGHAIEQYYQYEKYSHGEAVAIGMVQICKIAEQQGLTKEGTAFKIQAVVDKYSLPYTCNEETENLLSAILLDKKSSHQQITYILLQTIGESCLYKADNRWLLLAKRV